MSERGIVRVQEFLGTHRGRDKVLRSLQFCARLCSGCLQISGVSPGDGLMNVSSSISSTRVVLRLLDDVGMVAYLINSVKQLKVCYLNVSICNESVAEILERGAIAPSPSL